MCFAATVLSFTNYSPLVWSWNIMQCKALSPHF